MQQPRYIGGGGWPLGTRGSRGIVARPGAVGSSAAAPPGACTADMGCCRLLVQVTKRYKKEGVHSTVYFSDLLVQMDAKHLGELYNKTHPPKKVRGPCCRGPPGGVLLLYQQQPAPAHPPLSRTPILHAWHCVRAAPALHAAPTLPQPPLPPPTPPPRHPTPSATARPPRHPQVDVMQCALLQFPNRPGAPLFCAEQLIEGEGVQLMRLLLQASHAPVVAAEELRTTTTMTVVLGIGIPLIWF